MRARFSAMPDGEIVGLLTLDPGASDLPPAGPRELDIDPATNPDILAAYDTDSRSFRLVSGALTRNGVPVVVNPPGAAEQERITAGNAATVLAQLQAYRDTATPTNAQVVAATKLMARVCQVLIRRLA